jgi:hypothetical protein
MDIQQKRETMRSQRRGALAHVRNILKGLVRPLPFRISGHPYPPGTPRLAEEGLCCRVAAAVIAAQQAQAEGNAAAAKLHMDAAIAVVGSAPGVLERVRFHTATPEQWESYMVDFNYHHPHISSQ